MNKNDIAALEKFVFDTYLNDSKYEKVFADIESIIINSTSKIITMKISNPDVVGLFIGKKGANVNAVQIKINEKFPSGWRLKLNGCSKISDSGQKGHKISGSGQKGHFKDDRREIILKEGLPLTIPFSSLKDKKIVNHITTHVSNGEHVLITLFRDSMGESTYKLLSEVQGNMGKRMLNFLFQVMGKFPEFEITPFNWPDIHRSAHDIKRSTHPLISEHCRAAAIISSKENPVTNLSRFESALTEAVHSEILKTSRDKWVIVGDETGDLSEFEAKLSPNVESGRWHSAMCWIAIPPKSDLPALPLDFHCSGTAGISNYIKAINNLARTDDILYFTFPFQQGTISKNASNFGQDPHLSLWLDTLPIVLEYVSTKIVTPSQVDIFIEQVGILESGSTLIQPTALELSTSLKGRNNWKNISFDQLWVISKNPIEHPWIGYPDALGANENGKHNKWDESKKQNALKILEKTISAPYRQDSLSGPIHQALRNTAHPLVFLKSLSDLSSEDLRDYIQPFFSNAIDEALSSLNPGDWQNLLLHMDTHSKNKQGQNATALIHRFVNIVQTLDNLSNASDKFDFLLAMLGTSNHIGAIAQADQCITHIEVLIENGFKPRPNRLKKFENLSGGSKDNVFDFTHIRPLWEFPEDPMDIDDEAARYLGAQAQSRALRAEGDDIEKAENIEKILRHITTDNDNLNRRYTLHSELLMEQGDYDGARLNLEEKLPEKIEVDAKSLREGFYLAALLKSCVLSGANESAFAEHSKSVSASLNEHHPSQRIAYWCARWASEISQTTSPIVEQCCNHLIGLMREPLFTHDAAGIILACELLDLQSRGLIDVDAESFMEKVLSNSAETTRAWVAAHPPNEDDWLAPLNFNYR
jgi:hypothetical protein